MLNDQIEVHCPVNIKHYDGDMNLINEYNLKNLVVTTGKEYLAQRAANNDVAAISHVGIGTFNTEPVIGDIALAAPLSPRVASTVTASGTTTTLVTTFGSGVATGNIKEAGIFNDLTAGIMFSRLIFGAIEKTAADTLIITWEINFSVN